MNVIEFNPGWNRSIVVCMVDNTRLYLPSIRELIKNQADGVLDNLYKKGYHVLVHSDENLLLNYAANLKYKHALIFSTGTEFTNGNEFFNSLDKLFENDFFVAGHVLDRKEGYYELHHQCYVINLQHFIHIGRPEIGQPAMYSEHSQLEPFRSQVNFHDDYTPIWIERGYTEKKYLHKLHGWNIIKVAMENNLSVIVFDKSLRDNKMHFYPESPDDFHKQLSWAYHRLYFCHQQYVHKQPTETMDIEVKKFEQIVTPASSAWFTNYIDRDGTVMYYDYNQNSLDYWRANAPNIENVQYKFVLCDLLVNSDFIDELDPNKTTLVNLSNIFNYEGTTFFYSKEYRYFKQKELVDKIKHKVPDAEIYFSMEAKLFDQLPSWHINS